MIQEILKRCTVEGMVVKLPAGQLERKAYMDVKNSLELIGGKWKGGKISGFVFEEDPTELLAAIANGEQRNLKKEFQFFATPPELAFKLVRRMPVGYFDGMKLLEPSAGDGALIKAVREFKGMEIPFDAFELMELNRMKLAKLNDVTILGDDFMSCDLIDEYDLVIANPPFTNNQDIDHIGKMWQVCKPGGMIITMASCSWTFGSQKKQVQFKDWLKSIDAEQYVIAEGTFKDSGTTVQTTLLIIKKPVEYSPVPWITSDKKINKPVPQSSIKETVKNTSIRTCRTCGCTEDDCRQCIEKTGSPCHWIEQDLCSACLPETEDLLDDLEKLNDEIAQGTKELRKLLSPENNSDMNFFQNMYEQLDGIDISMTLKRKNGRLTICVLPQTASVLKPAVITGTPEELDTEFFNAVAAPLQEFKGLKVDLDNYQQSLKDAAAKKPEKTVAKSASEPKKEIKKAKPSTKETEKVTEPNLFAGV